MMISNVVVSITCLLGANLVTSRALLSFGV
jgi:hypothetical protein